MFLSPTLLFLTVFLSSAFGAMYGLFLLAIRRATRKSMIPFGPFIALGAVTAYLYGSAIVDWYLSFIKPSVCHYLRQGGGELCLI